MAEEDPNVLEPRWDLEAADSPLRGRVMFVREQAGSRELGAALYELGPGGAVSPYHVHHGNEEMLIVLAGTPALRTPDGTRRLRPGAVVSFPRGAEGAHRISNPGDEVARVLLISTMHSPDVAEHVDTGTVMASAGPDGEDWTFPAGSGRAFMEVWLEAMNAAAEKEGLG